MSKVGRNDPCPCGSGKKFKKCCQALEDASAGHRRDENHAVRAALDWLMARYPEETGAALETGFFGPPEEDGDLEFPPQFQGMLQVNSAEWLLTEARLEFEDGDIPTSALYLGPGGPLLTAHGRSWLEEINKRPLSLYEVCQVRPGEGVLVADQLHPEAPELWVRERSGSRNMVQWDILGGRLARQEGDWVFTGALYPFAREDGLALRDEILREMEGVDWQSDLAREVVAVNIIGSWLLSLSGRRPLPTLVDASTQDTIRLTTDHYRVSNWDALESVLAGQADVEGDRASGWIRFVEMGGEMRRSRARLDPKGADALEVSCRTLELADETRKWLARLARTALRFRIREVVDPRSPKVLESAANPRGRKAPVQVPEEVLREFMANLYGNWADAPIPALGDQTPRQAVASEQGRRAVIELLRSYQHAELRRVRDQGGEPFDFGFLWKQLGLDQGGR
jgi:hypothetical protein